MKQIIHRLFPRTLWNRETITLWGCAFGKLILFDIIWCLQTTFTSFSLPEVYVNSILVALILLLPLMLTGKKWTEYLLLFIVDGLLISNLMYSRTYNSAIPLESYLLAGNLSDFTASIIDSMRLIDILLPLSTIANILYIYNKVKKQQAEKASIGQTSQASYGLRLKQYLCTLLVALLLSSGLFALKGGWEKAFNQLDSANMYTCKVPMYTIFGNLLHEATEQKSVFTPQMKTEIAAWKSQQPAYQPLPDSIARKKTLVVIFCESLESWVINRKVEGKEITPNLNAAIADSHTLYAPHVLTQVKGGRSIDGQLLVNAGILPLMSGCYAMQFPYTHYPSLCKAMKEEHPELKSYLMTVDKPITWNQSVVAEDFGIQQMFFNDSWKNDEKVGERQGMMIERIKRWGERLLIAESTQQVCRHRLHQYHHHVRMILLRRRLTPLHHQGIVHHLTLQNIRAIHLSRDTQPLAGIRDSLSVWHEMQLLVLLAHIVERRSEEIECRIDAKLVEERILAIISLAHLDRVIAHSATDAEETGTYHHSRNKETADYLH